MKNPSKDVGAFDDLNRAQGENQVFGTNYDSRKPVWLVGLFFYHSQN